MDHHWWKRYVLAEGNETLVALAATLGDDDARIVAGRAAWLKGDVYGLGDAIAAIKGE
jgi:hypothetical protein